MYRNKIGIDEQAHMTEDEFNIFCERLTELETDYYIETVSKLVANHLAIWLKYSRGEHDLDSAIHLAMTEINLSSDELDLLKKKIGEQLRNRYSIEIIQNEPLILESKIPFHELEVK